MKKPLLSELSLREKIGQMLMPHTHDVYCRDAEKVSDVFCEREDLSDFRAEEELSAYLKKENFGAFRVDETDVWKAKNPDKAIDSALVKNFITKQSAMGAIPALTAGDFSFTGAADIIPDLSFLPAPLAVGAADSEELAYALGASLAKEMRLAGANLLLGPDVRIAHQFGTAMMTAFAPHDTARLVRLAKAYIKGATENGVAVALKHFPGGDRYDYRDPDISPTVISSDMDEWWREQGSILKEVIAGGVPSVMVNHTAFPAADDTVLEGHYIPASVSKKIVTDLLKGELGFDGVVVTDAIASPTLITCFVSPAELLIALVNAGNDIISGAFPGAGDVLERAVLDGVIDEARIDDAVSRILAMKEKLGLFAPDAPALDACEVQAETHHVSKQIAEHAITLVRDTQGLLPVAPARIKTATIVYFTHTDKLVPHMEHMKAEIEKRGIKVKLQHRVDEPQDMERVDMESDLILYVVYVAPGFPKGHPGLYGAECAGAQFTFSQGQTKSIGISMGYPYIHYDLFGNAETFINTYGCCDELIDACVEVIFGEREAVGNSPIKLEPDQIWY